MLPRVPRRNRPLHAVTYRYTPPPGEIGDDGMLIFSRSGFTRSPGAAQLFWLGDQLTSWDTHDGFGSALQVTHVTHVTRITMADTHDGFGSALQGALSGGMSGFSLTHSDIGGYTGAIARMFGHSVVRVVRDREMLMRWVEQNAFSDAVLRSHEGLLPIDNHQVRLRCAYSRLAPLPTRPYLTPHPSPHLTPGASHARFCSFLSPPPSPLPPLLARRATLCPHTATDVDRRGDAGAFPSLCPYLRRVAALPPLPNGGRGFPRLANRKASRPPLPT